MYIEMEINTHMNLHELFDKCLNKNLIDLTISGRKDKSQDEVSKVKIRPVIIKNNLLFRYLNTKGQKFTMTITVKLMSGII